MQCSAVQCSAGGPPAGPTMRALQSAMGLVTLQVQHCALRTVCVSVTLHCTLQQTKNGQKSTKKPPKKYQKSPKNGQKLLTCQPFLPHQQWKLFCHNVLQPKSSLPQLLHTYKCRMTTPALHTVIHCTLHCTLHCLLHCSLHCTLHYTLHCTLHAALIQCAVCWSTKS